MKKILFCCIFFLYTANIFAVTTKSSLTLKQCAAITDSEKRLQCFDNLTKKNKDEKNSAVSSVINSATIKAVLNDLQDAWGKNISAVTADSNNALLIHTTFAPLNQITYEVMLTVVCGRLSKDQKTLERLTAIAVLGQTDRQGYLFTSPLQCLSIAFQPLDQVRLVILGSTQEISNS